MNFEKLVIAPLLLSAAMTSYADERWYVSADLGVQTLSSQTLNYRDTFSSSASNLSFDAGFNAGGTLGYRLTTNWRLEADIMYRSNEQGGGTLAGVGDFDGGNLASLGVGLSAVYDFRPFSNKDFRVFVGAGPYFLQEVDIDFEQSGSETSFETDDIAVQLQFGVRYPIAERFFVDAGVRALLASDLDMQFAADTNRVVRSDYDPISFSVGFGYRW